MKNNNILEVAKRKIGNFDCIKKIDSGINSNVFKIKDEDGKILALKSYKKPTPQDPRNRCSNEAGFLEATKENRMTPCLIESFEKENIAIIEWIEGQRPKSITEEDIQKICLFTKEINSEKTKGMIEMKKQSASEHLQGGMNLLSGIQDRIKRLKCRRINDSNEKKARSLLVNRIEPEFVYHADLLMDKLNRTHWKNIEKDRIVSHSDVGIHNMIANDSRLYFIDFEYAGLDDMSKLACDWINQPENTLLNNQERLLIEGLMDLKLTSDDSWHRRYLDIKHIMKIKWSLIMLNGLGKGITLDQVEKTKRYIAQ